MLVNFLLKSQIFFPTSSFVNILLNSRIFFWSREYFFPNSSFANILLKSQIFFQIHRSRTLFELMTFLLFTRQGLFDDRGSQFFDIFLYLFFVVYCSSRTGIQDCLPRTVTVTVYVPASQLELVKEFLDLNDTLTALWGPRWRFS